MSIKDIRRIINGTKVTPTSIYRVINGGKKEIKRIYRVIDNDPIIVWDVDDSKDFIFTIEREDETALFESIVYSYFTHDGDSLTIDWGDGSTDVVTENISHTYADDVETATITVSGGNGITAIYSYWHVTDDSKVTSVIIPSTITALPDYAFSEFSGCKNIEIPNNITSFGNSCFYECTADLSIPAKLQYMGNSCFAFCESGMTDVVIPRSVTYTGTYLFYFNKALKSFKSYQNAPIHDYCFNDCTALESVYLKGIPAIYGHAIFPPQLHTITYDGNMSDLDLSYYDSVITYGLAAMWQDYGNEGETYTIQFNDGVKSFVGFGL